MKRIKQVDEKLHDEGIKMATTIDNFVNAMLTAGYKANMLLPSMAAYALVHAPKDDLADLMSGLIEIMLDRVEQQVRSEYEEEVQNESK